MAATLRILLCAALLAPASGGGALAQTAEPEDGVWTLRGSAPAEETEAPAASGPATEEELGEAITGRVERLQADGALAAERGTDGAEDQLRPRRPAPEARDDTAYDPLGIRVGSFLMLPSVELRGGYTTNAAGAAGGEPSFLSTVAPEVLFRSQWARHEATLTLRGAYDQYYDDETDDKPTANVEATARLDLPAEWTLALRGGYDFALQSVSSPDFPDGADHAPGVHTISGGSELAGELGHVVLELRTAFGTTIYEDATAGDVTIDQSDRDNTQVEGAVRLGYEVVPGLVPFVETGASRRIYHRETDANGIERSSTGIALRGGIAYDGAPVTTGELAIGWRQEDYDDQALSTLEALTVDGTLAWSPTELTTVRLDGTTSISPSTDPSTSGSVIYDTTVTVERSIRRNFTAEAFGGWRYEDFRGEGADTTTWTAGLGAIWKLNRQLWATGRFTQTWYDSTAAGADYDASAVTVGLRLQR